MSAVVPLSDVQAVPVTSIEQQLSHIWSAAGATRAATFNLIIYRPEAPVGGLDQVVGVVTAQNPCRAIVLFPSAEEGLSAQVGAYCPASGGKSASVCCEYITLQVGANAPLGQLKSLLLSLLIPDLPVVLWWDAPINVNEPLFRNLEDLSERLVFDSAQLTDPMKDLPALAARVHGGSPRVFSDLNWSRLSPWRELTAQAFDAPSTREALFSLNRVDLQYAKGSENEAWLYLVWLTSRLEWTYKSHEAAENGLLLHFFKGEAQLDVNFQEVPTSEEQGPFSAHLVSNQFGTTVIRSSGEGHHGCLMIDMEGKGTSQVCQIAPSDENSLEQLLSHDLYTRKQDLVWEEVVVAIAQIYRSIDP